MTAAFPLVELCAAAPLHTTGHVTSSYAFVDQLRHPAAAAVCQTVFQRHFPLAFSPPSLVHSPSDAPKLTEGRRDVRAGADPDGGEDGSGKLAVLIFIAHFEPWLAPDGMKFEAFTEYRLEDARRWR
jgi:hypothetical protein